MNYLLGSVALVAGTAITWWLVHLSCKDAATTRQPHPDRTDYQARYEADQKAGK